jgi:hypothetical protein
MTNPYSVVSERRLETRFENKQMFIKGVYKGNITSSLTVDSFGSFNFKLADLDEVTHFTNIYDMYRIVKIQVTIVPFNQQPLATTTSTYFAPLLMAIDYDDNATPTSTTQLYNASNLRIITSRQNYTFSFKPRALMAAYTGSFSGYASAENQWLDCASTDIIYYGLKWAIASSSSLPTFGVYARYFLEFKNVR